MTAAEVTVSRTRYSPLIRAVDVVCGLAQGVGLPIGDLEVGSILDAARRRTGLSDWGDEAFLEPMHRIVDNCNRAGFSNLGQVVVRQAFITAVANRLRVEEYHRRNPDAADVPIERPVFILGFPRTGTTLLQNLLSIEEGTRALKFWELQTPVPEQEDPEQDRRLRLAKARQTLRAAYLVAPEMDKVHEIGPETSEECWPLFANTFAVLNWDIAAGLVDYGDWLVQQDMTGPYGYYKRQLQVMAHFRPTRQFVLKCPEHLWFVDALLEVFPDAHLVWTHRDPVDVVASYCSLISMNRRMLHGSFDPVEIGDHITGRFAAGVGRAMQARDRHPGLDVYDVGFRSLIKDTPGTVRDIRRRFDLPQGEGADARIDEWLHNERKDKRGAHKYDAAMYGLTPERVYKSFAAYIERFQVPLRYR